MKPSALRIQRVYLLLILFNTLASSLIWGINTLFLLDAGLNNTQAFLANAFFTFGQLLFEIPTGIVADVKGRRTSYLLGTVTLAISTGVYLLAWYLGAALWLWAIASIILGLGFTFFSGATEAWLVDALDFAGFDGKLDDVFAKGQMVTGAAMLTGAVAGGVIAQYSSLAVPYMLRIGLLLITSVVAWKFMHDWGWEREQSVDLIGDVKKLFSTSVKFGLKNPAVRWIILAAPFTAGVNFYAFYAMQPFLLELYGNQTAYGIAGLAAAIVAGSQIVGGMLVPHIRRLFGRRTSVLMVSRGLSVVLLLSIGLVENFWLVISLLCLWGISGAAAQPVRQSYLNGLIPAKQRATVLSFDAMFASSSGVVVQPALGRVADVWSYSASFIGGAIFQLLALPFILLARQEKSESDPIK